MSLALGTSRKRTSRVAARVGVGDDSRYAQGIIKESLSPMQERGTDTDLRVSVLTPGASLWSDALARVDHDVYHLPEYVALAARHEGGSPIAVYAEAEGVRLLIPLVVRPVPTEYV